jgi:hypothetical protein
MKKLIFSALALVGLAIPIAVCSQQPPIIDRQLFRRSTDRWRTDLARRPVPILS